MLLRFFAVRQAVVEERKKEKTIKLLGTPAKGTSLSASIAKVEPASKKSRLKKPLRVGR
jgi:hypothetical protein